MSFPSLFLGTNLWLWHCWVPLPCMRSSGISISKTRNIRIHHICKDRLSRCLVSASRTSNQCTTHLGDRFHIFTFWTDFKSFIKWFWMFWKDYELKSGVSCQRSSSREIEKKVRIHSSDKVKSHWKSYNRKDYFVKKWNSSRNCQPPSRARQR